MVPADAVAETGLPIVVPAVGFDGNGTVIGFMVTFCTAGALMGLPAESSNQHVALCADATLGMMARTNSKASSRAHGSGT